jgi:hypothetical protein
LAATVPAARAQAVEGTLRDAAGERPLPGARLYLVDDAGLPADSVLTDRAGRFRLTAPAPGLYRVVFQIDGWATVPSDPMALESGSTVRLDFDVPLVSVAGLRQTGDRIRMEPEFQAALPEICGEAFRPWEAGILVGVVRSRATREPLAGARVAVATEQDGITRSTLSNERGTYILCNVPVGSSVRIIAESPDGVVETTEVEIRAGTVSWYDLPLGKL